MKNITYKVITDRILEMLSKGVVPWKRPWGTLNREAPKNIVSQRQYSGINLFLLNAWGWEDNRFITFKQAMQLGGHIKKGSKGCPVIYWNTLKKPVESDKGKPTEKEIPFLKYYRVFNVAQVEKVSWETPKQIERQFSPIEDAEKIVEGMPDKPIIEYGHIKPSYCVENDLLSMPRKEIFLSDEEYYCTLFHELAHSTGHQSRLNRKTIVESDGFSGKIYAKEELIAEMTSAFLCGKCGIENETIENSAAYIDGWRSAISMDIKLVVHASAKANQASDYILNQPNDNN